MKLVISYFSNQTLDWRMPVVPIEKKIKKPRQVEDNFEFYRHMTGRIQG